MSRSLEYVIMLFLFLLIVILFGWSENGHYQIQGQGMLVDTRNGDVWHAASGSKLSSINKQ